MGKKKPEKPEEPIECCAYCNQDLVCPWTTRIGNYFHPICSDCTEQARKDSFPIRMRRPEDRGPRKKIVDEPEADSE